MLFVAIVDPGQQSDAGSMGQPGGIMGRRIKEESHNQADRKIRAVGDWRRDDVGYCTGF